MAVRGRHRRHQPSRINRASLTVTAGGAGMALPLIGAGAVQAASLDVWEKVAACESSSSWHINTGNGYFGGLQFSQSTWESYGGTHYAPRADLASKDQQIAIAERVLKGQGPGAWPSCGPRAGLDRGGDAPDTTTQSPATKGNAPRTASVPGQRVLPEQATRRADPTTVPTVREMYTVTPGDSLSKIAREERVQGGWKRLYESNRPVVGDDPDLIHPGQRLTLRIAAPRKSVESPERIDGGKATKGAKAVPRVVTSPAVKPAPSKHPVAKTPPVKAPSAKAPATKAPASKPSTPKAPATKAPAPRSTPEAKPSAKPKPKPKATKPVSRPASKPRPAAAPDEDRYSAPIAAGIGTSYGTRGSSWSSGYHTGVDFPVPTGTSVKAVADARVVSAGWGGAYGYQVVLRHDDGRYSQYAHLSALTVREGQRVQGGQRIGRSGSTGNSSGPHLHFEVRTGPGYGSDIDPLAYLRARGVSI
ncbi:Putative secreted protein [Streptomyces venezuelae]|uniref:transglycosylase family protein n=1 Tax=Streptomyces gardneri TaxID=66892 RepID=UPI0006BCEC16|nr:transglycosylase family protein [Streptomyces gardneri]ALO12651.1 Putative secreted protein [Streptomyces venezuelae]QPK49381.1 transglycosylase family protein [Streptomyces gardneri]WRK40914.1 transglycosylase family protein [Streptomyces venezuelae]CUM36710.1 putative secreted protein [Streptomyces venezuelae]